MKRLGVRGEHAEMTFMNELWFAVVPPPSAPTIFLTPGRDGTRNAARRPGSGGRPRGCGFEEQGGGACTRIQRGVYPYSHFVCLSVCLSVPSHSKRFIHAPHTYKVFFSIL